MVARHLTRHFGVTHQLAVSTLRGQPHKPVLLLRPLATSATSAAAAAASQPFTLRLIPCIDADYFPLKRLLPTRGNVRIAALPGQPLPAGSVEPESDADGNPLTPSPASPVYNNSVLEDAQFLAHLAGLHVELYASRSLLDAVLLCKIWLRKCNPAGHADVLTGFQASMILLYLLRTGQVTAQLSSYQLFRSFLGFLARGADATTGAGMAFPSLLANNAAAARGKAARAAAAAAAAAAGPASLLGIPECAAALTSAFDCVLLDPSGTVNLLASVSLSGWRELQHHAATSLLLLADEARDVFDAIFLRSVHFAEFYDLTALVARLPAVAPVHDARSQWDLQ